MSTQSTPPTRADAPWAELIPADQWNVFQAGRAAAERAQVPFLLGGAMALAAFTGRWRNTKDIDFIVHAEDHQRLIDALLADGFRDYFSQQEYDRGWIFRAVRDDVVLDIIWKLPNHRVSVDQAWFDCAWPVRLRGTEYRAIPLEELIRVKLYVMQRERCDWVDVINALAGSVEQVKWDYLIARMGRDLPLLQAVLCVFSWLAPARAAAIPATIRERFRLPLIATDEPHAVEERRVALFDSRPWYAPFQPIDRPLER